MKQAVIDLGTNTFHLIIAEPGPPYVYTTLFRESRPAKIGQAGINQGIITEEATGRALEVLRYFGEILAEFGVDPAQVATIGTSAIRVAKNQAEFIETVRRETGLRIRAISGDEEAGLIYAGVRAAGALPPDATSLVMDIGGGSVEFILGGVERTFWQQSFEIGGQRLLERYVTTDPPTPAAIARLRDYLQEQLLPLTNAVHQYQPTVLVGASGSFDTLVDMHYQHEFGQWPDANQTAFTLPVEAFYLAYEQLLTRDRADRLALPGMIPLRVDLIVVGVCLIDYVLRSYGLRDIRVSRYALKEGVMAGLAT